MLGFLLVCGLPRMIPVNVKRLLLICEARMLHHCPMTSFREPFSTVCFLILVDSGALDVREEATHRHEMEVGFKLH